MGHGAAFSAQRSLTMFAQVRLYALGLLSPVTFEWVVLPQAGEKEGPPSFCGLSLDVLYAVPPCLDTSLPFIRQHGTASDNPAVDKSAHFDGSLGHGAASSAQRLLTMFAQVGYYESCCYRDNDVCFLAVPWPPNFLNRVRSTALYLWRLLMRSGDVESNPSPMTKAQEEKLEMVHGAVLRLEANNASVLESVNKISQMHLELKTDLDSLTKRVQVLESKMESVTPTGACGNNQGISNLQAKIDDLENRSRRSNVIFYGIEDGERFETWETSERLVRDFCTNRLDFSISSLARAHRIGRFSREKKRPIIAKLFNEKEVETILSKGFKLKNTPLSVARDYSEAVRDKRRKLLQF
ncbi:hypothetical protein HPB51_025706 [Rhipicephalus microplus]|uniref:Uncharacterized protein n=1 Tax=Rhipicephalus microplus TaxID=6941 RepID=A0A9J6EQE2_RHIMP|nr:hypothetical protein HPB51_025706 [Rhipicephalus microplus]